VHAFNLTNIFICVLFHAQPESEMSENSIEMSANIGDLQKLTSTMPVTLEKLQALLSKSGKTRNLHLRKEQISQGVLNALLRSLGRLVVEQVQTITCVK
jgi:hypothetical protein